MHRFYINPDDICDNRATIIDQEAKHIATVLRLATGNIIELVDGVGNSYESEIESANSKKVILKILKRSFLQAESPLHIAIAQAMIKDNKMDIILRHITELGIKEFIPFFALRSVPSPNKYKSKYNGCSDLKVERWKKIAKESIKQCGRTLLPVICNPISYEEVLNKAQFYSKKIVFWEKATAPLNTIQVKANTVLDYSIQNDNMFNQTQNALTLEQNNKTVDLSRNKEQNKIIVIIGPEGGFSKNEIETAKAHGFEPYSLGPRILRSDTASIAASALIQNIFGDLGRKKMDNDSWRLG